MTTRLRKTLNRPPPLQAARRRARPEAVLPAQALSAQALSAQALSAGGLGAWAWDLATGRVTCSADLESLVGLAPGAFGGTLQAVLDAVHPDDRALFEEASRRTLETGRDHHAVYRIIRPDGAIRWLEATGQVVRDGAGRAHALTGVSRDVTDRVAAEAEARARESRLQALADNVPVLIARVDAQGRYVFANRAYEDLLGVPAAHVVGRTMADVLGADAYEMIRPYVDRVLAGEAVTYDVTLPFRTVGARSIHGAYAPERGPGGEVTGFLLSAMDVTARKEAEEEAEAAARQAAAATRRLALIVENSHEAIFSTDRRGRVLSWNGGAERLYGWTAEEIVGQSVYRTFPSPQEAAQLPRRLAEMERAGQAREYEAVRVCKNGARREVAVTFSPAHDAQGGLTGRAFIVRDITAQKEGERERAHLLAQTEALLAEATARADRDPLTGLLNHRAFHEKLEEETERAAREGTFLAVAMLDLDHFKFFNDAYGHPVGDDALRRVADALRQGCRPYDTPARFGGDEFAVLMPGVGRGETEAVAARLARSLEGISICPPGGAEEVPLRLSVGLAVFPDESRSRTEAVALADKRLYRAKSGEGGARAAQGDVSERLRGELRGSVQGFSMLDALMTAVDARDRYTRRHSEEVLTRSLEIAEALGLDAPARQTVAVAALLHDVGNIGIPDAVLRKPGPLTDGERETVRQHPLMGAVMVGAVPGLEGALEAIRHHHEHWDGTGYPDGLRGEAIPLPARLLAVADAFSSLTSDRPYRRSMEPAQAHRILAQGAGTQWDPACVAAFLRARSA